MVNLADFLEKLISQMAVDQVSIVMWILKKNYSLSVSIRLYTQTISGTYCAVKKLLQNVKLVKLKQDGFISSFTG